MASQKHAVTEASPDIGWSSYCIKDFWRKSALLRKIGSHFAFPFRGHMLTASARTSAVARDLYGRDCALWA